MSHLFYYFLFNYSNVGNNRRFICPIPPLLNVAFDILSSKTYASHFLWFEVAWHVEEELKIFWPEVHSRFEAFFFPCHPMINCVLQFLCVRYSLRVSGDCGETGAPFTASSQASVHVGSADHVLYVTVLAMLGLNTLESADVHSVIILCRVSITVFWYLRIAFVYLLIHLSFRQYTHPPCVYPTKPTDPFE